MSVSAKQLSILFSAINNTAGAISEVKSGLAGVGQQAEETSATVEEGESSNQRSFGGTAMAMVGVGMQATSLVMSLSMTARTHLQLEQANIRVEASTLAVQKAQEAYDAAVQKFGPDSQQAKDASDALAIATERHGAAVDRANLVQGQYNNQMLSAAMNVIPTVIGMITTIIPLLGTHAAATGAVTTAQQGLNLAFLTSPIGIVVMAIVALVAILVVAYNTCEPFRNAVNALGGAIRTVLGGAIDWIVTAATFWWNNVFVPLGTFIAATFGPAISSLANAIQATLGSAVSFIRDMFTFWWNNILVPLGSFLAATLGPAISSIAGFLRDTLGSAISFVRDMISFWWNNILVPVATFLSATFGPVISGLGGALRDGLGAAISFIQGLFSGFMDIVNQVWGAIKGFWDWIQGIWSGITGFFSGLTSGAASATTTTTTPAAETVPYGSEPVAYQSAFLNPVRFVRTSVAMIHEGEVLGGESALRQRFASRGTGTVLQVSNDFHDNTFYTAEDVRDIIDQSHKDLVLMLQNMGLLVG